MLLINALTKQTSDLIYVNPVDVSFILNGTIKSETVRFIHEQGSVPANSVNPVGLGTSYSIYAIMEYDSHIQENALLIENGRGWKCGNIDTLSVDGEVYRKRAVMTFIKTLNASNIITSFKIGTVSGVINNTLNTIAITLPAGTLVTSITPVIVHGGRIINKSGAQDFTNPVSYTITAENLTTKTYVVTVVLA